MSYTNFDEIPITEAQQNSVAIKTSVVGDKLTGTVPQNKEVFDRYANLIVTHFNDLCDYIGNHLPDGDVGLTYTTEQIALICSTLGCTEADITL